MPVADDDAYAEEAFVDDHPGAGGGAGGASVAASKESSRLRIPGLPGVELPRAALRPPVVVVKREDENTVTVKRSSRGIEALQERNAEPTAAQQALRDFSSLHPAPVKKWSKALLNEVAYATSSKQLSEAARRKAKAEERAARDALQHAIFRRKPKADDGEPEDEAKVLAEFFARQEAMTRRQLESRVDGAAAADFAARSRSECPSCGAAQSYAEFKAGVRRCQKDACKGALYRPKTCWGDVQGSFLKRWHEFRVTKAKHLAELDAETMPPFRVTHKTRFDRATGTMVNEPIPVPHWSDVADEFFKRQEDVALRRKAHEAEAAAKAAEAAVSFVKQLKAKPYRFSQPLPSFHERQAAAAARGALTFEERLATYSDRA